MASTIVIKLYAELHQKVQSHTVAQDKLEMKKADNLLKGSAQEILGSKWKPKGRHQGLR